LVPAQAVLNTDQMPDERQFCVFTYQLITWQTDLRIFFPASLVFPLLFAL